MKTLHYNCFSGICGDMHLGALIDLGVKLEYLQTELKKLGINGWQLQCTTASSNAINGTKIKVLIDTTDHHARTFQDIKKIILSSSLSEPSKTKSINIFYKLALAESKIHNTPINEVHFHEIGAVDSIIDIVGAAICQEALQVNKITCSAVAVGSGVVNCSHGLLPVPAPATAEILKGIPIIVGDINRESTTPTGAAILATTVNKFNPSFNGKITSIGYGIGEYLDSTTSLLQVILYE